MKPVNSFSIRLFLLITQACFSQQFESCEFQAWCQSFSKNQNQKISCHGRMARHSRFSQCQKLERPKSGVRTLKGRDQSAIAAIAAIVTSDWCRSKTCATEGFQGLLCLVICCLQCKLRRPFTSRSLITFHPRCSRISFTKHLHAPKFAPHCNDTMLVHSSPFGTALNLGGTQSTHNMRFPGRHHFTSLQFTMAHFQTMSGAPWNYEL